MAVALAGAVAASAADLVRLEAATRTVGAVTLEFPAIAYRPVSVGSDPRASHAAAVSEAVGVEVDPAQDLVMEATNRFLFRDPRDPGMLLKIYKTGAASPVWIAKSLQREIALQRYLQRLGVPMAAIDEDPSLLARGIVRQRRADGQGLDALHPDGYRPGSDAAVDRLLATIAAHDADIKEAVRRQLGLTFLNAVDCRTTRSVGVDLGRCHANVFIERETRTPILVDW